MLAELENPLKITGGVGCKFCRYWQKYEQNSELKESLSLVGDNWGKCTNRVNTSLATMLDETFRCFSSSRDRLPIIGWIVSSIDTHECQRFKQATNK